MSAALPPPRRRLIGLDVLRAIAVFLVLGRHMAPPPYELPQLARLPFLVWARGGWVGVDLFFVLSGFLVSGLLFSEFKRRGRLQIGRFFVRRAWKIYPPFFVLIATTWAVSWWRGTETPVSLLLAEVFFVQSYFPGMWNHTWSLAVEEHFYLLLPLVLTTLVRRRAAKPNPFRALVPLALGLSAWGLTARLTNLHVRDAYAHLTHLAASHLRIDSLFFGVLISYAYHFHREAFERLVGPRQQRLFWVGAGLLSPAFLFRLESTPAIHTVGLTLFYIGSGLMVMSAVFWRTRGSGPFGVVAGVGVYSYSVYLWHMPVERWFSSRLAFHGEPATGFLLEAGSYLLTSVVVGVVMAKLVELPALRLRDRLHPDLGSGAVAVAQRVEPPLSGSD